VGWKFILVLGLFFDALIPPTTDLRFKIEGGPPTWEQWARSSMASKLADGFDVTLDYLPDDTGHFAEIKD
jgi:hypothetical protein